MILEKIGKASSIKRLRHINIQYFFAKDRLNSVYVTIGHCPTDNMWGGFFTKPMQGSKFIKSGSVILGKSKANEPSPPRGVLDPKDGSIADDIGVVSKLLGGTYVHARKVKTRENGEII